MIKLLEILILLTLINLLYCQYIKQKNDLQNLTNDYYYTSVGQSYIDIKEDNFIFDNINNNNQVIYYRFNITKDSDELFFDYQSEYGCLYISFEKSVSINYNGFTFCSEGKNNIFNISKNNILEKIGQSQNDIIIGLNVIIGVGYSSSETEQNIYFDYSLKISYRKTGINIFEINSEHKILCNPEKINEDIYGCLFIFVYNNNNDLQKNNDLLIYTSSEKNEIYADYINKEIYNNWNTTYLSDNIPNINSSYNNFMKDIDFINIPHFDSDKYVYILIKSNKEEIIEVISQIISKDEEVQFPSINKIKMYSINSTSNLNLYFNDSSLLDGDEISVTLITLYGKASIYIDSDESSKYITDIGENKLMFMIDVDSCKEEKNCKMEITNLEENDEYIFYIYYSKKPFHILNELIYGKSNKIFYNNYKYQIMLYEKIPNINASININLQLYNISKINTDNFEIEILFISEKDIYELKKNYQKINNYKNRIKEKFVPILSVANIYLTYSDIQSFNIQEDPIMLIYMINNNNTNDIKNIIISSSIMHVNSIKSCSERICYFGQLNKEDRIIYILKGNPKYHLMRLEFSCNSEYLGWSVKRTKDNNDYMKNDTDLSFVTEKWINGRELLTMYIENGEDIYLSVFKNQKYVNQNLTSHVFKYINSAKNSDFKNYYTKYDSLDYNKEEKIISINKLKNIPSSSNINYYLKIITNDGYIQNELINTIALTKSNIYKIIKGTNNDNNIIFDLNDYINNEDTYYLNAYSIINEENCDFEYASYSGLIIKVIKEKPKVIEKNLKLTIAAISIGSLTVLIMFISCIRYQKRRDEDFDYEFARLLVI